MKICVPHRSCFALKKDGKIVAACLCCPPSNKKLYKQSLVCEMCLAVSLGIPKLLQSGPSMKRHEAEVKKTSEAHATYAPTPHWYVFCFASDAEHQGKGYGRELMTFLTELADQTGHPMYLETYGPRNERFYTRNGFTVKERMVIETNGHGTLDKHGGILAMLRQPKRY